MKKIFIFIIAIILVTLLGVMIAKKIDESSATKQTNSEEFDNAKKEQIRDEVKNREEDKEKEINAEEENKVTEKKEDNKENQEKTAVEKAIDLVKKDWGEDDTVYFAEDRNIR